MIALTWQTMLLLAIAYFAGCFIGCFARKLVGAGPVVEHAGVPAAIAVGADAGPSREVARSAAVLAPLAAVAVERAVPVPSSAPSIGNAFRRADHDTPSDSTLAIEPPSEPPPIAPRATTPSPAPIAPPISAAAAVVTAQASAVSDDLTRIRAIDRTLETKLNQLGVRHYAEIAAWTSEQVKSLSEKLGFSGRIEHENWIEQAQILARGGLTSYATMLTRTAAPAPVAAPQAMPIPGPEVSSRAAFAMPRREAPMPEPAPVAVPGAGGRDTLQRIGGISAEIEKLLNAQGINRFSQVAGWGEADVARLEKLLGTSDRIGRENWVEQAQILARGGATAYSREFDRRAVPTVPNTPVAVAPEASRPVSVTPDLSGMRSVRSEAFRGADSLAAKPTGTPDDLKRIRGIGILIETKLNAMGVTSYEQIANWTAVDVATVAHKLDFKGRIERENWIEQARILASGGHTDFSRRFERGEV